MNEELSENEHNYIFVGKSGAFVPIQPGRGAGLLFRRKDDKDYAVAGTKGYRWLESSMVRELGLEDAVDLSYFEALSKKARQAIEEFGSFTEFIG
jgi:hypothetical protein